MPVHGYRNDFEISHDPNRMVFATCLADQFSIILPVADPLVYLETPDVFLCF